jgi:hypothetical protein
MDQGAEDKNDWFLMTANVIGFNGKKEGYPVEVCQNCTWHINRPSYCGGLDSYVGRKDSCVNFKVK